MEAAGLASRSPAMVGRAVLAIEVSTEASPTEMMIAAMAPSRWWGGRPSRESVLVMAHSPVRRQSRPERHRNTAASSLWERKARALPPVPFQLAEGGQSEPLAPPPWTRWGLRPQIPNYLSLRISKAPPLM